MSIPNMTYPAAPTQSQLLAYRNAARTAYNNSKQAAADAGATSSLRWTEAGAATSDNAAYAWLKGELDAFNADVATFNKQASVDPTVKKQVGLGKIEREITFSQMVKFVFDLKKPEDGPTISRYARVLDLVDCNKDKLAAVDVYATTTFIQELGGFEATLHAARYLSGPDQPVTSMPEIDLSLSSLLFNAKPFATIAMNDNIQQAYPVVLIGKANGDKVDVLGRVNLGEDATEGLLQHVDPKAFGNTQPTAKFVHDTILLAQAVDEGGKGVFTEDGTIAGKLYKQQRAYCLVPSAEGEAKLFVCSRYVTSGIVIKAKPAHSEVALGKVSKPLILERAQSRIMETVLRPAVSPYVQTLTANADLAGDVTWHLSANAKKSPDIDFEWTAIDQYPPYIPPDYAPDMQVVVELAELSKLIEYVAKMRQRAIDAGSNKFQSEVKLTGVPYNIPISFGRKTSKQVIATFMFNTDCKTDVDLNALNKVLPPILACAQDPVSFGFANGHMLSIEFWTAEGNYTVYVPAVQKKTKNGSNAECFKPITEAAFAAD